jgi:hypothetical protein
VTTQRERATVSEQIYDPHPMQERAFDRLETPSSVSPLTSTTPTAAKPPATAKPPSHSRSAGRIEESSIVVDRPVLDDHAATS